MDKVTNTTSEDVEKSIGSLYAKLLAKRKAEKEEKAAKKEEEKALRKQEEEEKYTKEDGTKMSKKEKAERDLDNWKEVVIGLTGEDLEYTSKKKNKKKYRKWIDDEELNAILDQKKKKVKKKNYNKEFEPELNMLKNLVADQNKFTADLQKRFNFAAGPAAKDGLAPNKTLVELANVISSGRSNSLGVLREIGAIKKTIAELYMKQKKLDSDLSGSSSIDSTDLGLMGSSLASSIFNTPTMDYNPQPTTAVNPPNNMMSQYASTAVPNNPPVQQYQEFDPASWGGVPLTNDYTKFESIPHEIVVEKNVNTGSMRFKAVRSDDGSELVGCPVPTSDLSRLSINEQDKTVKGQFDEIYKLELVG